MTIVTANTRLARSLRREHDLARKAHGERVWESPDILPWGAWLARLWSEASYAGEQNRLLLSASQEQVLWEQAVAASAEGMDLMNPAGAAQLAAEAWKLMHDWSLPQDAGEFQGIPDAEAFFRWMQSFESALARRNFITAAELPAALGGLTAGTRAGLAVEGPVSYAGFDEPTPAQSRLFESVGATRLNQREPVSAPNQFRLSLPGSSEELLAAAQWAREKLEANLETAIGVIIPDLASRRPAVERTFADVLGRQGAFHIAAPEPLADSPLINAALLVLDLCRGISLAECGVLLRSPWFGHTPQEGARVDIELRRMGVSTVTLARSELARLFPRLAPARAEMARSQRPSEWSRSFSRLVTVSGWPGRRVLSGAEHQAIESWKDLLAEFARLDAVLGEVDFEDALTRLISLAQETAFGPADEDEPVQIMGVLEAAGARFDALWIAGLEDRAWPPAPRPNPFLPLAMQRLAGTPNSSAEQQAAYAQRVTTRLLGTAAEVICSYPARDGEEKLRPSPLITHLSETKFTPTVFRMSPARLDLVALDLVANDTPPPLTPHGVQRGGMTVVADQSACPFRAFARHRLNARSLDEVEPGLTPQERGTVTHKALELIWNHLKGQRALLQLPDAELSTLIRQSVREALTSRLGPESRKLTGMQSLEEKRLSGILRDWLQLEKQRPEFEVVSQETTRRFVLGGLELEIKTDRVDRYPASGTLAIIDYKTGSTSAVRDWEGDRPKAPQVPLYCIAAELPVSSAMFAQLAAGDLKLIGHSDCGEPRVKPLKNRVVSELVKDWSGVLHVLGEEFIRGEARVDPARGGQTCRDCDVQPLCRISVTSETDEDEAGE